MCFPARHEPERLAVELLPPPEHDQLGLVGLNNGHQPRAGVIFTEPPASSILRLICAASSLVTPSLISVGRLKISCNSAPTRFMPDISLKILAPRSSDRRRPLASRRSDHHRRPSPSTFSLFVSLSRLRCIPTRY